MERFKASSLPSLPQEHLRHADIQTTTIYTRLAPQDLQKVVKLFDEKTEVQRTKGFHPVLPGTEIFHGKSQRNRGGGPNGIRALVGHDLASPIRGVATRH